MYNFLIHNGCGSVHRSLNPYCNGCTPMGNTKQLLSWRKWAKNEYSESKIKCPYTILQIKAELALRLHITTKRELQKFNSFKKKKNGNV